MNDKESSGRTKGASQRPADERDMLHLEALTASMKPKMLIVEDDADQRELICEVMRMHFGSQAEPNAAQIVSVGSGAECMAKNPCEFDIVLLDYHLPDATGIDLLEQIVGKCDVPVVFVTSVNDTSVAAEAIRLGAQDYIVKLGDYLFTLPLVVVKNIRQHALKRENVRLQTELTASLEELRVKNIQLEESLRKLQTMAATDHLTGLSNRRAFSESLDRYYNEAVRYGFDLTCIMSDLDHYKALNDTLGHQVGDKVLEATAEVIRSNLRGSDAAARYGGDEFVMLLPHTSVEMALSVSERIRQQVVLATRRQAKTDVGVTLSIGIASLNSDCPNSADTLVAMADRALYVAKDHGKNRIVTFGQIGAAAQATSR